MQESGRLEIIPLKCTLTIQGQYPAFLHPESPQGSPSGVPVVTWWLQQPLFTDIAGNIFYVTEARRETWPDLPSEPLLGIPATHPADTLISDLWPPELWENKCLLF